VKIRTPIQYRAAQKRQVHRPRRHMSDWSAYAEARFLGSRSTVGHFAKPNHATRAVSITACFPDAPKGERPYHPGAGVSTHATPLTDRQRLGNYERRNGRITHRQGRRLRHKHRRSLRTAA
jgi:hypothetical protein